MTRRPALRRKQPPHGIRPERVDRQPVQRIGWHRDDGAVEDPVRGFADGVTLRTLLRRQLGYGIKEIRRKSIESHS